MNFRPIALALALTCALPFAHGQANDTLKKIKQSGTISVGHRDSSIPFSYTINGSEHIGFGMDLCMKVVDAVKEKLGMRDLKVAYVSVTSQNRIPLVQNGTIDLECGPTTNLMARQQQVAFSPTYFVANVTAAVKKSSGINSLMELNGKTVTTTAGTTATSLLRARGRAGEMQVQEVFGKDYSESFLLLSGDRASAFVMDDVILAGVIAQQNDPQDYKILTDVLRQEPYGIMLRKDDPQFKGLVDVTFKSLMRSGEINAMYDKWFTKPVPPRGVNLRLPMSEAVREAYKHPDDKGI